MSLLSADYAHCVLIVIDFQNDFILQICEAVRL